MKKKSALNAVERKILVRLLFSIYFAVMFWLLFGQRLGAERPDGYGAYLQTNTNLIPFATVKLYISLLRRTTNPYLIRHACVNLLGNVIVFIPLGMMLPKIFPKLRAAWRLLLLVTAIIIAVEVLQFLTFLGSCDVDDLILNVFGAALGWAFWKMSEARREK